MPAELEDDTFDYVVQGTGLTESILAAALAHAGRRVLHLDANPYYGGTSASLNLPAVEELLDSTKGSDSASDGGIHQPSPFPHGAQRLEGFGLPPDAHRRVIVDTFPRTLLAAGPTVQAMTGTGVGHYLDFRALDGIYVAQDGLRRLPASRADVFRDRYLDVKEKRLLMRYVTTTAKTEESEGMLDEHMREAGLTDRTRSFVLHGVVLADDDVPLAVAREKVARFQTSAARYRTPTPLLAPDYGSGEIAQAFCRKCAVLGGTYILRRTVKHISSDNATVSVTTDKDEQISCRAFFAATLGNTPVWRAACVIDGAIVQGDVNRALFVIPSDKVGNNVAVRMHMFDSSTGMCPEGMRFLHVYAAGNDASADDVLTVLRKYVRFPNDEVVEEDKEDTAASDEAVDNDMDDEDEDDEEQEQAACDAKKKPRLLWGVVYLRGASTSLEVVEGPVKGAHLLPEGIPEADGQYCMDLAKKAYESVVDDIAFFEEKPSEDDDNDEAETEQVVKAAVEDLVTNAIDGAGAT